MSCVTSERIEAFAETILASESALRDRSLEELCQGLNASDLLASTERLESFWRSAENLYHRVRALFFLSAIYRYHLPAQLTDDRVGLLPYDAYQHMLSRRFIEAIDCMLAEQRVRGPDHTLSSGLAKSYHQLGIQTLADQVRRSVKSVRGNQWMFRIGNPEEHPLRVAPALLRTDASTGQYPILCERTSVRMDFTHSGWSDIFFLGMDYPEGARVINASIDLGVHGRDDQPRPPVEAYVRVIDRPVLRLISVDLGAEAEIEEIDEVFDFGKDYLGLLKAAVIAAGIVPPAMDGCHQRMATLLHSLLGSRQLGLEIVSQVNDIPKGSRLAVSTNLLGCLISCLMRATGQIASLQEGLQEEDRRLVAARAILGEWLGGSGGGWQDSGGVWPGIKLIHGAVATELDPEYGISRGRLLPAHEILGANEVSPATRKALQESLILVHGGMAQNVGPILEMVTEKYLVRGKSEWVARQRAVAILDEMRSALREGNLKRVGQLTTENFTGPLQAIIPWCTNHYTNRLISQCRQQYQEQFWGFWMLGGMSGGGMGFIFDPQVKQEAQAWLQQSMLATKRAMEESLPFAMDPVVYDFAINDRGSWATLLQDEHAVMPRGYYAIVAPQWIKQEMRELTDQVQREMMRLGASYRQAGSDGSWLLQRLLPQPRKEASDRKRLSALLEENGFDSLQHEQIRSELRAGRIGLAQNRLPAQVRIADVGRNDVVDGRTSAGQEPSDEGQKALQEGRVAVVTLAAGAGSRWTGGAGVVKGLHPFGLFEGKHRSFIELHLAKSRKTAQEMGAVIPHVFTTGYMTHKPIAKAMEETRSFAYPGPVYLSPGKSVGLRFIPTIRDLRFAWDEVAQQVLDEQQQKVRESSRAALIAWAQSQGQANDYTDNVPLQCMHPVGHWYEVPNMMRNGVMARMLEAQPQLTTLLLHNVDTLGASLDPAILTSHLRGNGCLSFEVIGRRIDDRGGGLARVDGKLRLLEGLAMPHEEDEFALTFYNSMTTWIDIDRLLAFFQLTRQDLTDGKRVEEAVREVAKQLPTYITIKEVKRRWGHGQEDVLPVAQFEKLWGDMTSLSEVQCQFIAVDTMRGQQLKDPAQLDGWLRDGSRDFVADLCQWD